MKRFWSFSIALLTVLGYLTTASASQLEPIKLVKPQTDTGKPLMQALLNRRSQRVFSNEPLPPQVMSNLLWAAFGVNRADGKRTAPSASNMQQIDIYVAMEKGLYLYEAKEHVLNPVIAGDLRALAGRQQFTQEAPVNLIFVVDFERMGNRSQEQKEFYAATDTGFISQNVYLFCASEGLATVVLGFVDKPALARAMGLPSTKRVVLTQPVGFPKNPAGESEK